MGGEKYLKKKWGGTKIWLLYALKDTHMMTPTWAFWELLSKSQKKTTNCDHSPVGGKRDSRRVVRRCDHVWSRMPLRVSCFGDVIAQVWENNISEIWLLAP